MRRYHPSLAGVGLGVGLTATAAMGELEGESDAMVVVPPQAASTRAAAMNSASVATQMDFLRLERLMTPIPPHRATTSDARAGPLSGVPYDETCTPGSSWRQAFVTVAGQRVGGPLSDLTGRSVRGRRPLDGSRSAVAKEARCPHGWRASGETNDPARHTSGLRRPRSDLERLVLEVGGDELVRVGRRVDELVGQRLAVAYVLDLGRENQPRRAVDLGVEGRVWRRWPPRRTRPPRGSRAGSS